MTLEMIAARMAELGHPTRLAIVRHLVKAGNTGCAVGDVQQALGVPASTLSHHISRLVKVGLVEQVRDSRTLYCFCKFEAINQVSEFLIAECCVDEKCR